MSVRAAIITFPARSGTGTQTVTGVQDAEGSFIGKLFFFQSAYAAINTLTAGNVAYPWYADFRGIDTGTVRSAATTADAYSPFNFKAVSSAVSLGDHSIVDQWTDNFGTVHIERTAKISAIRSGEFDILYDTNGRTGDDILVLVLGGDVDVTFTTVTNGTKTIASKPQGLLAMPVPTPASSGATSGGTGGQNIPWGFATRDGDYGASNLYVVNQESNYIVQRTTAWTTAIDGSGTLNASLPTVSAWNDLSIVIANNAGAIGSQPIVFSGDLLRCVGTMVTQPATAISQTIDLGINAKAVFFFSVGAVAATTVGSPVGQMVMGWATGTSVPVQVGWWSGEKTPGNVSPAFGARYLSDSSVLRFGTPNGASTTFTNVAAVTAISPTAGTVDVDWSLVDGTQRQYLVFALGEDIPSPPTPSFHTTTFVRRRLRRSPIVWSEKQGLQTNVRVNLIAVDMQPGVGTQVDLPDPQVMIRASKDGGRTWTSERLLAAGRIGEYTKRLNAWRWGQGRQWVVEVTTSDPVIFNLVNLYIDAEPGTS